MHNKLSLDDEYIISNYNDNWWTHHNGLVSFIRSYGPEFNGSPEDLLGLDCLNGGIGEVEVVADSLHISGGDRVLDIGSGLGGPARLISTWKGCQVDGVDLASNQVSSASELNNLFKKSKNNPSFFEGSACSLPFENEIFDKAYAIESLVHVKDKVKAVEELRRVLKTGGKVAIADYSVSGSTAALSELFPMGYFPWEKNERTFIFEQSGFELVHIEDRSEELADLYSGFANLFGKRGFDLPTFVYGLNWWLEGANLANSLKRILFFLKFNFQKKKAGEILLGEKLQRIIKFCEIQARECRNQNIKYELVVFQKGEPDQCLH